MSLNLWSAWKTVFTAKSRRPFRRHDRRPTLEWLDERCLMSASPLGTGVEHFVAPTGDDWNTGAIDQPFLTIRRALDAAQPGDIITLRNGVYEGGVTIDIDHLTLRSMPGEWAVVESPIIPFGDGHAESVLRYSFDVQGGLLQNIEITGGYYYGVMFWNWWDSNWDAGSTHIGASGITIDGCKIHDTGVDAIKITPAANDIAILNSEIYNTGRRTTSSADGIDNNNGDRMIARGNYIHSIPGIGIVTSGGTEGSLIEQNFIRDTAGAGIVNGFYTELEWIQPADNPDYFASIDTIVRNNIIVNAGQAGVGIYGALNAQVYNNTLINAAADAQAPIQFGGYDMWISNTAPHYYHVSSVNPMVVNNLIATSPDNHTRMVDIREGSVTGPLTLDYNHYFGASTRGVLFIDRNLTGDGTPEQTFSQWQNTYGYDLHSTVGDPFLDANWHLSPGSPAIDAALSLAGLTHDFDGNPRLADPPQPDIGADELGAGLNRMLPPAPFGAPSIEIAQRAYHELEANTISVKVVRHGSATDTVAVQYATLDGSAKAGQDYNAVAGTLTFLPGETEKVIAIALSADSLAEGDEHFLLTLSNPTTDGAYPVRLGHQKTASMTIDDTQTPMTVQYRTLWVAPNGSDVAGDGSEAKPWKSLQHAADSVGPGDFVIVKPGLYNGMNLSADGKPDARITFHAQPGVVIDDPNPENNQDGINLEGADFITIEGFEIHGMPRAGIRSVLNDGVILRGNKVDQNEWWGILTGWSENILVENNVASRSVREHGIYISNSSDGAVVRNNLVWGNNDSGIQFNADGSLPGDGVHSNNLVEGNVIYDNGLGGGAALNFDGFQNSIVRNNLLYDNHASGIVLYVDVAADSSTNNLVENNTVVMAEDARWALLVWNGSSGNTFVNNILLNRNPNRGSVTIEHGSEPAYSDYNVLKNSFQIDGYNQGFAAWQAFTGGMDSHSIFATEADLFVDPTAGDFRLKAGSPAIDVGDPFHGPATDLYGQARSAGAGIDIGAFEAGMFTQSVQFDWADSIGYEAIGMAEVTVMRTGSTAGILTVDYFTGGGTAGIGDFSAASGQITFGPGEARKTFLVFINNDFEIEGLETVGLHLASPTTSDGAPVVLAGPGATLHIVSDDQWRPGSFAFANSSVTVDETAGSVTITVHRTGGTSGDVSVDFATALYTPARVPTWERRHTDLIYPVDPATSADTGVDYTSMHGTLHFADGETAKTITVPVLNDNWYEGVEAFLINLSNPTGGATLGKQAQTKVRIHSDDVKLSGTFVWASPTYTVTEGTPTINVTVNRVGGGNVAANVSLYHTGAGSGSVGSAWDDYGPIPNTLSFAVGELSKTISIPIIDDNYTEGPEAFSIKLYSPTNGATVGDHTTVVTILDNESTFYFSAPDGKFTVNEGAGVAQVKIVRQGSNATPASLRIKTSEWSSAAASVDFTPVNVIVNFVPGESFKIVEVPIVNDMLMEPTESFPVSMSECVGAQQGSWTYSVDIIDDDVAASPGKFEFSSSKYAVLENAGQLVVAVKRIGGSDGTVSVKYATFDGTSGIGFDQYAWAGSDYNSSTGVLTFAPGETEKTFTVTIKNDTSVEKNEFFQVSLSNPAGGATLGAVTKAAVTLQEDDSSIEFGSSTITVNESAGFVTITLVRRGSTVGTASVDLGLSYTSGPAGDLELPANPTVTFADGEAVKTVQIPLRNNAMKDGTRSFGFVLKNPLGTKLGSSQWATVKILDND